MKSFEICDEQDNGSTVLWRTGGPKSGTAALELNQLAKPEGRISLAENNADPSSIGV